MAGGATLLKSAGVKNHQNELSWIGIPEGAEQTQTVRTILDSMGISGNREQFILIVHKLDNFNFS